ncbi:dTDP-4-dehydrorhamnose reductase [Vibrio cyclitrophicus]|uniref:dTDP-4-dehydrorhamnose reductase n=1 Tax=Vibrio cyclitrophicus TaxID=47951 RepID=UPI000C828716|nr:dTDP-4-dehydrorhamnose reductase [Vibrio cyclitrophicus]PMK23542.1 dTDP-4-dehydrorhamnose reductase [Vibrio cyclitrophicus]
MARVLVTGGNGQLGRCLQDRAAQFGFEVIALDASDLDITDKYKVISFVEQVRPIAIINAAAYTAVDNAEKDYDLTYKVNAAGPQYLAEAAKRVAIPFLHVSTDYVFDGQSCEPYSPRDTPNPAGAYGKTKLEGEQLVLAAHTQAIIVRTAWVFSEYGNNFVKTMLRLGSNRDELGVIADQYGCPTYAGDLADALFQLLTNALEIDEWSGYGIHHFCGDEATSWHGFTRTILEFAKQQALLENRPKLNAIRTEDYPLPAPRPAYSVMNCQSLEALIETKRDWKASLRFVLEQLKA